uniref:Prolyl 3-hydroxylase family member 4 (inactive) n=1 Tax=Nothobranchius furzeri TaxID=105023 RepID=A0A8C6KUW2_NOTFU
MVPFCAKGHLVSLFFFASFLKTPSAQYEDYSFKDFPKEDLMPLTAAYGLALDHYAAGNWTGSIRFLDLRLRRLLRDSVSYCSNLCSSKHTEPIFTAAPDQRCRAQIPALQLPPPTREILEEFSRRSPYGYLHFAHSKLKDLQRAIPCAFTFLQKNPEDHEMQQLTEEYKNEYDLSGYLIDQEQRPSEVSFVRGVKLISSGNYSSSVELLEEALRLYLEEYDLCQVDCEGISCVSSDRDFYVLIAEVYVDTLKCKLKCEENLMPNVGGYFVKNLVATIYHYLQYAYYKLNDGRRAAPCACSYSLFQPEDPVMKDNLMYYKAYREQWGLQPEHFRPRMEALKHYNQTITQKQMLTFAEMYLEIDDEGFFGPEDAALLASESPDAEFEGLGDYEESIYSNWRQMRGKGDAGEPDV